MEIIVKPTTACNGTCVYCAASASASGHGFFPKEWLGELFDRFASWLVENPSERLTIIWHGGEPLLRGIDFYRTVIHEQRQAFGELGPRVRNTIQSNLTLLTPEWLDCLSELIGDQPVGTSFDIVEGVRGARGIPCLADAWLRALDLLRGRGFRIGMVYVVHRKSLGRARELYYYFRNLDPSMTVRFNPLYAEGLAKSVIIKPLHITADEYGEFLVQLTDVWLADGARARVLPLLEWRAGWRGGARLSCDNSGRCHFTHLCIVPNGTAYHCGRASDNEAHPLGNVLRHRLSDLLGSSLRQKLASRPARLRAGQCRECRYWLLCHGGCPYLAWIYHRDLFRETYFCPGYRRVFEHLESCWGPPPMPKGEPSEKQ